MRLNKYMAHRPFPKQVAFMLFSGSEALYGGAAAGGKSDVALMCALQYVDVEGYAALVLRRTFRALRQPGALIDRSHAWLDGTDARWDGQAMLWRFPSKAVLAFGHMDDKNAMETIASAEYQFIYPDEATQFTQYEWQAMQARLRKPASGPLSHVPLRMRGGTNPGGRGHEWVKSYFVKRPSTEDRLFLQAKLEDNPYVDRESYLKSLSHLPPIVRQAMLDGNWDLQIGAGIFRREWFRPAPKPSASLVVAAVRYWDTAATEDTGNNDPDWTAGVLFAKTEDGLYYVVDVVRVRATSGSVRRLAMDTAQRDLDWLGRGKYRMWKEQGPGDDGKANADMWQQDAEARGIPFGRDKKTVDKMERAGPWATMCEGGNVRLCPGEWNEAYLDEHANFDDGEHDDQEDASSGACAMMCGRMTGVQDFYAARAKARQEGNAARR